MSKGLKDKTVLVTQATDYMGPAIIELFAGEGAQISNWKGRVPEGTELNEKIDDIGNIDVLIANLAYDPCSTPVENIKDDDWTNLFDTMVHPLMKLVRICAPKMAERGSGKIIAITSAAPLRGIPGSTAYCAARGAQNAFVRAAGLEFASRNVQINAIAQNYVSNPAFFPDSLVETERFKNHLKRNVPRGRLAKASESAELALFLASNRSDFIVGQIIPFSGGWTTTI